MIRQEIFDSPVSKKQNCYHDQKYHIIFCKRLGLIKNKILNPIYNDDILMTSASWFTYTHSMQANTEKINTDELAHVYSGFIFMKAIDIAKFLQRDIFRTGLV